MSTTESSVFRLKPADGDRLKVNSSLRLKLVNAEVLIGRFVLMFLNVVLDMLFRHCTHGRTEVSSSPQMLTPVALLEVG